MSQGHIRKRGKTWSFIVELPGDPETGKRKQRWVSGFKTKVQNEVVLQTGAVLKVDFGLEVGDVTAAADQDACDAGDGQEKPAVFHGPIGTTRGCRKQVGRHRRATNHNVGAAFGQFGR